MEADHAEEVLVPEQGNKRLPNAFILFCKKHRSIVKEKYPNLENRNITKILGEWWTSLGPEEKDAFNNLAAELKEHHLSKEAAAAAQRKLQSQAPVASTTTTTTTPAMLGQVALRDQIVETTSSLSAAVVLAAASPTAACWQKQRLGGSGWQPKPPVVQQPQQQQQPSQQQNTAPNSTVASSRNSSGSSSPEPSPKQSETPNSVSEAAPNPKKTFKQRYLADEKAKMVSTAAEPETNACEALLQLAGGGVHHQGQPPASGESTRSNSGTCSPKDGDASGSSSRRAASGVAGFQSLRDAVWTKVAQTILMQEKEKGNDVQGTDQPINLSNQCTIRGQTIIEHIIENILDEPMPHGQGLNNNDGGETAEQIKERIYQSLKDDIMNRAANNMPDEFKGRNVQWNALPNPKAPGVNPLPNGAVLLPVTAANPAAVKKQSANNSSAAAVAVKKDEPPPSPSSKPSVSVTLVPVYNSSKPESASNGVGSGPAEIPLNLSTTPPQTPVSSGSNGGVAITITTSPAKKILLDDDDDDIRRSSRSCKGRRYQEFKDAVGRKVRRSHRSGDSSDLMSEEETSLTPLNLLTTSPKHNASSESNGIQPQGYVRMSVAIDLPQEKPAAAAAPSANAKFDVDKELSAIPALDLDLFQQKILNNRMAARAAAVAAAAGGAPIPAGVAALATQHALPPLAPIAGVSMIAKRNAPSPTDVAGGGQISKKKPRKSVEPTKSMPPLTQIIQDAS